jgi:hypothetical protein
MKLTGILALFGLMFTAAAQDVVTVNVTSFGSGNEGGGVSPFFRVSRTGSYSNAVRVWFSLGGTASNGADYVLTNTSVLIPAWTNYAFVRPTIINDSEVETNETIVLTIQSPQLPPPSIQYYIGTSSVASITIADNDTVTTPTNHPPVVRITEPTSNSIFMAPVDITIYAEPHDADGSVVTVEFFANATSLGSVTPNPATAGPQNPWHITWSNTPPGNYSLRAKATDNLGATNWSPAVYIAVRAEEPPRAVINVAAVAREASEDGSKGKFLITRSGETNVAVNVYYRLSGAASNGTDYATLPESTALDAGVNRAEIIIDPIDDALVESTESVVLTILPPFCPLAIYPPPPQCYDIGPSNSATVWIADNDHAPTNSPPFVQLTTPTNNASFPAPAHIRLDATAGDADGSVTSIYFFAGSNRLATIPVTSTPGAPASASFIWSNVNAGTYTLTARAVDDREAFAMSAPATIYVRGTNSPPPTNGAMIVTVSAPDAFAIEGPFTNRYATNYYGTNHTGGTNWTTWRTNTWQTNTAMFRVSRSHTNGDLVVNYVLGGTATNGIDYTSLPGNVTIRAGERSARVFVTPIDDALAEGIETIVLHLIPSPTSAYGIGWPNQAGAILIDNDVPRPPTTTLNDALFHLCAPATNGFIYRLEFSTDLTVWVPVYTNVVTEGAVQFVDPDATTSPMRFYRVVPTPTLPPE